MSIEYALSLNKLTTPPSYAPRVRPRATLGLEQIAERLAASSTLAPADVQATLVAFTSLIEGEITAGNWVQLDGIGIITSSLSGRVPGPMDPLPDDSQVDIGFRADSRLLRNVRANASVARIDPGDQSPMLLSLTAKVGPGGGSIAAGNVYELAGDRLRINPPATDEGVFLTPGSGGALRVVNYLENGDKRLLFELPSGIASSTTYTLSVSSRRPRSTILRTTAWPGVFTGV